MIASSGTWGSLCYGFLVSLGGCCHLDGLDSGGALARVGDCLWPAAVIVRGLAPFSAKSLKVALVNCSCH